MPPRKSPHPRLSVPERLKRGPDSLLTRAELAELLGVARETVWAWEQRGFIPVAVRKGSTERKASLFSTAELRAVLRAAIGAGLAPELLTRRVGAPALRPSFIPNPEKPKTAGCVSIA